MRIQLTLIALLLAVLCVVLFIKFTRRKEEDKLRKRAYQVKSSFDVSGRGDSLYKPFDEFFSQADSIEKADFVSFSDYAEIDSKIDKIEYPSNAHVYAIAGSDYMASKSKLQIALENADAKHYAPETWVLESDSPERDGLYILKKNIQRQQGTKITRDLEYIKNKARGDGYVVCQELLQNPLLINGRKINLRVYLLVVYDKETVKMHYYEDGFIYYTPDVFQKNSEKLSENVTTGYIDRSVYEKNPLTHLDLFEFLGSEHSAALQKNIHALFETLTKAYVPILEKENANSKNIRFNLYGVDVAPDENFDVKIMEINKAPDLSYKDERDGKLKRSCVRDMLFSVGMIPKTDITSGFIAV